MKHPYDGKNDISDSEMYCKKVAWMVKNSPEWDEEKQTLEEYIDTLPDYPTDEQVEGFNHLYVGPIASPKKKETVSEQA